MTPKKKTPDEGPAKQHERFKEIAKKIDADESGEKFERAFAQVQPAMSKKTK